MTFEQFQRTGSHTDDLGAMLRDESWIGIAGRIYCGTLFIALDEGRWSVLIGNQEPYFDNLQDAELYLFGFATSEGIDLPLWFKEFCDYRDMPAIPTDWEDVSWHNDVCPSFNYEPHFLINAKSAAVRIFVDYLDESLRECQGHKRFTAYHNNEELMQPIGSMLIETDNWSELLGAI
jgi:hypothetical protein